MCYSCTLSSLPHAVLLRLGKRECMREQWVLDASTRGAKENIKDIMP